MEIKGYDFDCLETAMKNLGEAVDYAKNSCNLDMDQFINLFISSGYAELFENGNPKIIVGMSGTELVLNILEKTGFSFDIPAIKNNFDYSPEYWCGWILAYYEWESGFSFQYIHSHISMKDILDLYPTLHEANEKKAFEVFSERIKSEIKSTRLQERRKKCNMSQKELSLKSGLNLRTLQQYETGAKDINKASAMSVYALSRALNCKVEDLLEMI